MMRTTITLDDCLAAELKRILIDTGRPFKDVINKTIRTGLAVRQQPQPKLYHLQPSHLGTLMVAGTLEKALQLADELEDTALLGQLEQWK